jgi:hypothetical protein
VTAFNGHKKEIDRYIKALKHSESSSLAAGIAQAFQFAQMNSMYNFGYAFGFYMGGVSVANSIDDGCWDCQTGGTVLAAIW